MPCSEAMWPHRNALAAGDLILIYLGAPEWEFIGRAELASAVHAWTPSEARLWPGDSSRGVLLAQVEEWDPPVPMSIVLSRLDPAAKARADFEAGSYESPRTNMRPSSRWQPGGRPRLADLIFGSARRIVASRSCEQLNSRADTGQRLLLASFSGRVPPPSLGGEVINRTQRSPYADLTEAEASVVRAGQERELLEELILLSAAWTGFPLFPVSSRRSASRPSTCPQDKHE
jgi:hypothetical protein